MKKFKARLIFVAPLVIGLAYLAYGRWETRKPYVSHAFKSAIYAEERQYAVVVPEGYEASEGPWPTILYLHGHGEVGDDLSFLLRRGLVREIGEGLEIPFIVVAPQANWTDEYQTAWKRNEPDVLRVLEDARERYRIDPDRIYLTGISMGGIGSFYFASQYPDLFAAVAPVAGEGNPEWTAQYGDLPFWVFHGLEDDIIPATGSEEMVQAMEERGMDVRYTGFPRLRHDIWPHTYQNQQLYEWFLSHRRNESSS